MSRNLFENFEQIIHIELLDKIEASPYPPDDYYTEVTALISKDVKSIFKKIISIKVDNSTRNKAGWIVQSYQEKVDDLMGTLGIFMDKLGFTINDYVVSGSWQALIMEILEFLKDTMNLLISRHSDLFDIHLDMSDIMEAFFIKETTQKLKEELNQLQEGSACYEVFKQLLVPLEEPIGCFHYCQLFYFRALGQDTANILQQETEDAVQAEQIRQLLWKFNFNHPGYVSIIWEQYMAHLGDSQGKERVKKCLEIKKKVVLNKPLNGAHLYFMQPSLAKQSESWLNTELNCTRALMAAEAIIAANPFADFKLKTKLSLKQFAGLIRIFYEKGILHHEDRRELIRFFATHVVPSSGKAFTLAAFTRSYDQNKDGVFLQQLMGLLGLKGI
ncbi:hypothetical protein GFS24_09460 [Chitinophaga sp. SYP-B3965]|uniref:hypothetical protein n=1 Tax=Chitinophaga sp. SYP-B3965 TaxID=2663120 RepID=UPI00129972C3|nr:hypothetical protein [Chitinophaga sp. SYP-B3965]MRG45343.1 hypothetical protein [Chitinophaga sp. SYP-B3965]